MYLKIKKRKISIFLFLILNQFLINAYALNYGKSDLLFSNKNNLHKSNNKKFENLLVEKIYKVDSILTKEDIDELEKFVDETFDPNNSDDFKNQIKNLSPNNNDSELLKKEIKSQDNKDNKSQKKEIKSQDNKDNKLQKKEETSTFKSKKGTKGIQTNFKRI